ncbi:MAG: DUF364 domain-containing protein [Candidatus Euphemobacter frigidus]|nr:DUF364 domain-containing protein [Candidatus Euphemobacter frigidus]MDP8275851.1 DUF364 domain-containing protein [Candidatus Euphemobacter frigidus]
MIYEQLQNYFSELVRSHELEGEEIRVLTRPLTAEEAIGTPKDDDYPLLKGRERLMEAQFRSAKGHAYTDLFGNYEASLGEIVTFPLVNNFKRAVFIAALNAVMRSLDLVEGTIHCRNEEPEECARDLNDYLKDNFGILERVALVGLQPRLLEALAEKYLVRAVDLDPENIGRTRGGLRIESPEDIEEIIAWTELLFVTGTTVVNGTIEQFMNRDRPVVFYGVTIAGPARILNLNRFCARGH